MSFPLTRLRRLRRTAALRAMVRETSLSPANLVLPLFVVEGEGVRQPIPSLPGVARLSPDGAAKAAADAAGLGVGGVILFGVPARKDHDGAGAADPEGVVPQAIGAVRDAAPELTVWADVCLCGYAEHGHCGVVDEEGRIDNDATLPLLADAARTFARAGADVIAPSDMMDGRVGEIREALEDAGLVETVIVSYAAKYASGFYGPFREAARSAPEFGDRSSYQMDPANAREAVREAALDVAEGADAVMVKPALPYLDVIRRIREELNVPVAAYQVSGEYAMLKAAAEKGWLDERRAVLETLTAIRRAGADAILTYHAVEAARWLA